MFEPGSDRTILSTLPTIAAIATMAASVAALVPATAAGDDWPQYLGPTRDGRSAETGILRQWPEDGPRILWRTDVGIGYSSVAVAGGRVYTMMAESGDELAVAFDAKSGEELWRTRTGRARSDSYGGGPRATPSVDGDRVYVLGALADLHCLRAASGEAVWSKDLDKELGARVPQWGVSSSPLVDGDALIVLAGGGKKRSIVAFDKSSGAVRWSAESGLPGYSSPIVATIGGVSQVIAMTADAVIGVARDDGRRLWHAPWRTRYDVNAATPLFVPKSGIFVSSGYDAGAALLQVVAEEGDFEVYQVWRSKVMRNHYGTSVRDGQYLYGFDELALKCVDILDGSEQWRGRAGGKGSLVWADGHLLVLGGSGQLSLVEATPEAFRVLAKADVAGGKTWAAPALADGVLYVRGWNQLLAVRVGMPPAPPAAQSQ